MRRLLLIAATALTALTAVLIVSAQDSDDTAADMSGELPITADVRYQVGVGDTLDTIAALFDVSLECLADTNADMIASPGVIFPGDVLDVRVACPPYNGADFVAFPRPVDDGVGGGGSGYVVRVGDTLDEIAFAFDVSTIALQEFNDIENAGQIFAGQVLEIPADAPPYGQVPPPAGVNIDPEQGGVAEGFDPTAGEIYVIQPRDTIDTLGAFYDKDVTCILETNNITEPRRLQPRTVIFIPNACPPYAGLGIPASRILPADETPADVPTVGVVEAATVVEPTDALPATDSATATIVVPTITRTPTQETLSIEEVGTGGAVTPTATFTPVAINTETATVAVTTNAVTATLDPADVQATTDAKNTAAAPVMTEEMMDMMTEEMMEEASPTATIAFSPTPTVTIEVTEEMMEGAMTEEAVAAASPTPELIEEGIVEDEDGTIIDVLGELDVDS